MSEHFVQYKTTVRCMACVISHEVKGGELHLRQGLIFPWQPEKLARMSFLFSQLAVPSTHRAGPQRTPPSPPQTQYHRLKNDMTKEKTLQSHSVWRMHICTYGIVSACSCSSDEVTACTPESEGGEFVTTVYTYRIGLSTQKRRKNFGKLQNWKKWQFLSLSHTHTHTHTHTTRLLYACLRCVTQLGIITAMYGTSTYVHIIHTCYIKVCGHVQTTHQTCS